MWLPKIESEIVQTVQSGRLEETSIFDAKKELPSKNSEIAKDIAAMANDGGVIIYGIGENDQKRLTILNPIPLKGQAEKIDAIVRSSIAEPPIIRISTITTAENPLVGYLVVFVPPSERAPHMVIVKGEHRFYGRTATGNIPLTEGEVARLYNRRQETEIDRDKLLDAEIKASPLEPNENYAFLFLFARPVFVKENFFDSVLKNGVNLQTVLNDLIKQVCSGTIYRCYFQPDFNPVANWKRRAEGFWGQMSYPSADTLTAPKETLNLQVNFDGTGHLFCGGVSERDNQGILNIFAENIAGLTIRFVTYMARLYDQARYFGMVDMGIAIIGLKGSIVYTQDLRLIGARSPYDLDNYRKNNRFSVLNILDDSQSPAKYLIMPFISAISQDRIDPFQST